MPPFEAVPLIQGLKDKVDAVLAQGPFPSHARTASPCVRPIWLLIRLLTGNKLYVASGAGNLSVYRIDEGPGKFSFRSWAPILALTIGPARIDDGSAYKATLLEIKKAASRRAIEQLGFIKELDTLVVLSGSSLSGPFLLSLIFLAATTELNQVFLLAL
jgi:hypothetical protein